VNAFGRLIEAILHPGNKTAFMERNRTPTKDELTQQRKPYDVAWIGIADAFNDITFKPPNRFSGDINCINLKPRDLSAVPQPPKSLALRYKALRKRVDWVWWACHQSGSGDDPENFLDPKKNEEHVYYWYKVLKSEEHGDLHNTVITKLDEDQGMNGEQKVSEIPKCRKKGKRKNQEELDKENRKKSKAEVKINVNALSNDVLLIKKFRLAQDAVNADPNCPIAKEMLEHAKSQWRTAHPTHTNNDG